MSRGKAADAERMRGAWACMRRDPGYSAAWAAEAGPVRFDAVAFPLKVQTGPDLAAAAWGLAVWKDPDVEAWRTPFLPASLSRSYRPRSWVVPTWIQSNTLRTQPV